MTQSGEGTLMNERWRPSGWRGRLARTAGVVSMTLAVAAGCTGGLDADQESPQASTQAAATSEGIPSPESSVPSVFEALDGLEPGPVSDLSPAVQVAMEIPRLPVGDISDAMVYTLPEFVIPVQVDVEANEFEDRIIPSGAQLIESPEGYIVAATLPVDEKLLACSVGPMQDYWTKPAALDILVKADQQTPPGGERDVRLTLDWGPLNKKNPVVVQCIKVPQ